MVGDILLTCVCISGEVVAWHEKDEKRKFCCASASEWPRPQPLHNDLLDINGGSGKQRVICVWINILNLSFSNLLMLYLTPCEF